MAPSNPEQQKKQQFLAKTIEHVDITKFDPRPLVQQMSAMAFQARNLNRATEIYSMMVKEKECGIILCLAGSLISAGLKKVVVDMLRANMVDAIVSTGANIVDQDFFEGLGFKHYIGTPFVNDAELRDLAIDRIYDTYIDEDELRICDDTIAQLCDELKPRAYSSREFIREMGRHLSKHGKCEDSIVLEAFKRDVPIFCPAFSDCSAGFGFVMHQAKKQKAGEKFMTLDSAADFLELTKIKLHCKETGLFMIGGGVPKNFAQDIVVAAECLGFEVTMHKYAVQLTVADERDGALSGSTLKEASSWGKVDLAYEQMVFGEATVTMPLIVGSVWHERAWEKRSAKKLAAVCEAPVPEVETV